MTKKLAVIFGVVFVLVGILGFIPNPIVGNNAGNVIFLTDGIHNLVHIIIGVVLLIAGGKSMAAARKALITFGVVYLILALDGFVEKDSLLGFVTQNTADTWLHLVLAVVLLAVGLPAAKGMSMSNQSSTM